MPRVALEVEKAETGAPSNQTSVVITRPLILTCNSTECHVPRLTVGPVVVSCVTSFHNTSWLCGLT